MEQEKKPGLAGLELLFLAAAVSVLAVVTALAFWFAVPLSVSPPQKACSSVPLIEAVRVDLNTASVEALCTLPGVGEKKACAIVELRLRNGAFRQLSDLLAIPGITQDLLDSWQGLVTLS
ncbi:MAG: ComEA family DNA-binding protein [Faecalibacterium sp.]